MPRRSPFSLPLAAMLTAGAGFLAWRYRSTIRSWGVALASRMASFVSSSARPCSHFVAAWLLEKLGKVPEDLTSWTAWRAMGSELWDAVNVADWSAPYSGIEYVAKLVGSPAIYVAAGQPAPELDLDRWYYVQLWWMDGTPGIDADSDRGHSKLVKRTGSGQFRVLDSNEKRGYRDSTVNEWLDGAEAGLVALPVA